MIVQIGRVNMLSMDGKIFFSNKQVINFSSSSRFCEFFLEGVEGGRGIDQNVI